VAAPEPDNEAAYHALSAKLLSETREELIRADTKAQILLAATGVVISVVLGGVLAGDWSPSTLGCGAEIIWWLGSIAAAVGIVSLIVAIFPRLKPLSSGRVTYFEDVRRYEKCEDLVRDLKVEAGRGDRDADQLLNLSRIAHRKYRAVQVAVIALGSAAALCSLAALVG
jgi:hypothetical protein